MWRNLVQCSAVTIVRCAVQCITVHAKVHCAVTVTKVRCQHLLQGGTGSALGHQYWGPRVRENVKIQEFCLQVDNFPPPMSLTGDIFQAQLPNLDFQFKYKKYCYCGFKKKYYLQSGCSGQSVSQSSAPFWMEWQILLTFRIFSICFYKCKRAIKLYILSFSLNMWVPLQSLKFLHIKTNIRPYRGLNHNQTKNLQQHIGRNTFQNICVNSSKAHSIFGSYNHSLVNTVH